MSTVRFCSAAKASLLWARFFYSLLDMDEQRRYSLCMAGIKDLAGAYERVSAIIQARLADFKALYATRDDEALFAEMCFCVCTPQTNAHRAWDAAALLKKRGLLARGGEARPALLNESAIAELRGRVVGVTGKTVDFRGQVQHNFNSISLLDPAKYPPAQYVAHSAVPLPVLRSRFDSLVDGCREDIRGFLRFVFDGERGKAFSEAPAAVTNHHAYAHGLLEHTVTVTESARAMALQYKTVYPELDVSVVVAGALLHDLGKITSYAMTPAPEITLPGAALDHIAIGYAEFTRLAGEANLPRDAAIHLGHIILSHHGHKEFGSPVVPSTLEALIVASADALDFLLFCWKDATGDMPAGQSVSAFSHVAQRRFWRPEPGER